MVSTKTPPTLWEKLTHSRIVSLIVSASVFFIVLLLLWNQYFRDSNVANSATNDKSDDESEIILNPATGLSGYAGHYLQLEYWENNNNYLQARQFYGPVSHWLSDDADFNGRAFLGYLSVGDYDRATIFIDSLQNLPPRQTLPDYELKELKAWLSQHPDFATRAYADWGNLFTVMKMLRRNDMGQARHFLDKISADNIIFTIAPQIGYLTYDGTGAANNSKYAKKLTPNLQNSGLFLSPLARKHQWQEIIDIITQSQKDISTFDLNTRIFYIHALYHKRRKDEALQVIDSLAPNHHIGRLVYEQISRDITNDDLQPLPQDKIYYINQQILTMVQMLYNNEFLLKDGMLLARLGLYLEPNNAALVSTIADLLTEQANAQNKQDDDAKHYDAAIALREQLIPAYQDEGFPLWAKFNNQFTLSILYSQQETDDDGARSIDILRDLQAQYPNIYHLYLQEGIIHSVNKNYKKALQAYNKAFNVLPFQDYKKLQPNIETVRDIMEQGETASFYSQENIDQWFAFSRLFYLRGIAYERLGKHRLSDKDLLFAVALDPSNANTLNYLAYGWADRNVNIDDAIFLLKRAVAADNNNAAIIDSLAWAYYKAGDYQTATSFLEQAIQLMPYDPEINDHLGDAYWQLGLKRQARFQWQRAIDQAPETDKLKKITKKLDKGL
ncbi:MAG: tetratricopeptide repeat protein [Alphaproteobacteria bacterium]|nr:tetratricopeptide repeat protein [Alphaproteobacteria bacterium]